MSQADHQERGNKNDDSTDGDLKKGQFFRLDAQAKEWSDKTIKRVHSERISRASHRTRVSNAIRQIRKKGPERSI
jgi:hypothetical protein